MKVKLVNNKGNSNPHIRCIKQKMQKMVYVFDNVYSLNIYKNKDKTRQLFNEFYLEYVCNMRVNTILTDRISFRTKTLKHYFKCLIRLIDVNQSIIYYAVNSISSFSDALSKIIGEWCTNYKLSFKTKSLKHYFCKIVVNLHN